MEQSWTLRPATAEDGPWLAELKARAMRPDLERLGLWDPAWARQRFVEGFVPGNTRVIVLADGTEVGCVAVRPDRTVQWIEHFYLDPGVQGRGIGGQVLRRVLAEAADGRPFRLAIDRGSGVQRLYERHGFVHVQDDANGVDQIFENRLPNHRFGYGGTTVEARRTPVELIDQLGVPVNVHAPTMDGSTASMTSHD